MLESTDTPVEFVDHLGDHPRLRHQLGQGAISGYLYNKAGQTLANQPYHVVRQEQG